MKIYKNTKTTISNANLEFWPRWNAIIDCLFLARDISFYEYEVHRSAVKRESVRPHAGLPFDTVYTTMSIAT